MSTIDPGAQSAPAPDGAPPAAVADATPAPKFYTEDHVKQLIRERDEAKAALRTQAPAPASKGKEPAPTASEVAELRSELELKDAIQDIAPHLTREQRNVVRDLFKVQRPGSDGLEAWITKTAGVFGRTNTAAPVTSEPAPGNAQQAAAPRTGSLGTPATAVSETMPTDPHELARRGLWAALTPEQRKAAMDAKAAQSSPFASRFAQAAKRGR
jgi:hypothetical protein